MPEPADESQWTLLTNHGAALIYIAEHPEATIREVADAIAVQERAGARILRQLRDAGYLKARRVGRRNTYELDISLPLRHEVGREFRGGRPPRGARRHRALDAPRQYREARERSASTIELG